MHYIGTFIGLFGILKYILDRTFIDCLNHFGEAMADSLKHSGKLTREEQQNLVLDISTRLWARVVDDPAKRKVSLLSRAHSYAGSLYRYLVPGPVRDVLFVPAYIVTYPVRLFIGRKKMDLLRDQTRKMALQGLWSFIVPAIASVLLASILVQEVEYVRVVLQPMWNSA